MPTRSFIDIYLDRELARARKRARAARESAALSSSKDTVGVLVGMLAGQARAALASLGLAALPFLVVGVQVVATDLTRAISNSPQRGASLVVAQSVAFLPLVLIAILLAILLRSALQLIGNRRRRQDDQELVLLRILGALTASWALLLLSADLVGIHLPVWARWIVVVAPTVLVLAAIVVLLALRVLGAVEQAEQITPVIVPSPQNPEITALDERIQRLTQIREWLGDDALRTLVDEAIGKQVVASERRQAVYSIIIGVVSLIAGWLLSSVSPFSLIGHH